jgi:hypothetical protein
MNIGTVTSGGTTDLTFNATGTLAGGLPAPSGGNTVTTPGSLVIALAGTTGAVEYITPTNFVEAISTFPTAATTTAFHTSDLLLLYQGGTIVSVGSIGGLFAAFETYQTTQQPSISLTSPGTVAHGTIFEVTGTFYNVGTLQTVQQIVNGSTQTLGPGSSVSLTATPNLQIYPGTIASASNVSFGVVMGTLFSNTVLITVT